MGTVGRLLSGAWRIVSRIIDRSFHEWSTWAVEQPVAAALELDLVATVLEGRADKRRNPQGWRSRRDRGIAERLRLQARRLRFADDVNDVRAVCKSPPGTLKSD